MIKDDNGNIIATDVEYATSFWSRFMGLMFRTKETFPQEKCLFFDNCNSIHMFFMKFPIDVLYLDKELNVVRIVRNLQPGKVDFGDKKAYYVIELNANTIVGEPKKIYIE